MRSDTPALVGAGQNRHTAVLCLRAVDLHEIVEVKLAVGEQAVIHAECVHANLKGREGGVIDAEMALALFKHHSGRYVTVTDKSENVRLFFGKRELTFAFST